LGIVIKQSLRNTVIIYIAFAIGGINALFLYTRFLTDEYYGLVTYLLSTANILMPLTAFGVQYSIVKFFSSYTTKIERDKFLSSVLLLPLFIAIPIAIIGNVFYEQISSYLSIKNPIIKNYTFVIYLVAVATAYFEIFYAWAKVQMQSVFGNIIKEMFTRVTVMLLLVLVFLKIINAQQFIYMLTVAYFLRMLIMMLYALKLYKPKFTLQFPSNFTEVLKYSLYIILAGSAGAILLDIDKFMLPQKKAIELAAFYGVGVYIASVIEAPGRAMSHILQPLTAKALNEGNNEEVASLYKRSSINLLLICGLIFLLVNTNLHELYYLLPTDYSQGTIVVLMISFAKLFTMFLGSNGAIISNSQYYKILLPYGIAMALSVYFLNDWLIDEYGMNGAALSTLLVVFIFNLIKLWYVKKKFGIVPTTNKTVPIIIVITALFGIFYFWNFSFHPIINIILKSACLTFVYLFLVLKMNISKDINNLIYKFVKF
jgi:O-antigen/teichoic acid export membrane protein